MKKSFCKKCGAELNGTSFCTSCGYRAEKKASMLSLLLFVLGICSTFFAAILWMINCMQRVQDFINFLDIHNGSAVYLLIYLFIGCWGMIVSAVLMLRKISLWKYILGISYTIIHMLITVAIIIMNVFSEHIASDNILFLCEIGMKYAPMIKFVFLDFAACVLFISSMKSDVKKN